MSIIKIATLSLLVLESVTASPFPRRHRWRHTKTVTAYHTVETTVEAGATPIAAAPTPDVPVPAAPTPDAPAQAPAPVVSQDPVVAPEAPSALPAPAPEKAANPVSIPAVSIPAAAPTGSAPAPSTPSTKRGVAFSDASLLSAFAGKASWSYNWDDKASGAMPAGIQFIPTNWGPRTFGDWNTQAATAIKAGADALLGFNEPDIAGQAEMSVADAVSSWKQYMEPFKSQARLASPAVTSQQGDPNKGLNYLKQFVDACNGCQIDIIAIHWYGSTLADVPNFFDHVNNAKEMFPGKPIWLTEFGLLNTDTASLASFFDQTLQFLDNEPAVERYAGFMASDGAMFSGNTLNAAGVSYIA